MRLPISSPTTIFFFFNDTATTDIYTLSLHDALPISMVALGSNIFTTCPTLMRLTNVTPQTKGTCDAERLIGEEGDRKSTRLNSSHVEISYAVFCLKKKTTRASETHDIKTHS